ncbi:MAG: hypothetical protein MI924_25425 [Chloroflexales bacterium]|nr:hypothetical protein [Chloroflexales bacterium]
MPIVTIQFLEDADQSPIGHEAVQMLADALGDLFGSGVAGTWVKLTYLPRAHYAENRATVSLQQRPVFVEILKATLPPVDARRRSPACGGGCRRRLATPSGQRPCPVSPRRNRADGFRGRTHSRLSARCCGCVERRHLLRDDGGMLGRTASK